MPISNPLRAEGLEIIDSSYPSFAAEVQKFLDPVAFGKAEPLLPYSLIIVNNTRRYIWSFSVIYTFPEWISASGRAWQFQFSPTAPILEHRYMLEPGATFLMTPVSTFVALRDAKGNPQQQPYLDEGLERVLQLFITEQSKEKIEASIDSVIFEDGLLAGPDTLNRMNMMNSRFRANSDLLLSIGKLTGAELRSELEALSVASAEPPAEYSRRKAKAAKGLLELLDRKGEGAVQEAIGVMRGQKEFSGYQVTRRKQNEETR
jgi:hypothetical protein